MFNFLIALQFLTRVPVTLLRMPEPEEMGRSALYYPLVGGLIGAVLWGIGYLLPEQNAWLQAVLLLVFWVVVTGALHLDGFADMLDAWAGGHGDKERTLALMKDPRSGPMAVIGLFLLLLLKFVLLVKILELQWFAPLLLAPWLARLGLLWLLANVPYVREQGLGSYISQHLPRSLLPKLFMINLLLLVFWGWLAVWLVIFNVLALFWFRHNLLQKIGGTTGDTAGAWVEISEVLSLFVAVCFWS
ncbi:adenosylcobinamide-GDP ribazoletransferase [Pseudomonas sp. F1_0610]|uniref:adenosylcobinamide-GDP ribazoletransferase n=1 Tax=Pseudomonas sp. F1_0610 TaxID=3114284 RepID=UPI0039C2227E